MKVKVIIFVLFGEIFSFTSGKKLDPIERVKELTKYSREWVKDNMVNNNFYFFFTKKKTNRKKIKKKSRKTKNVLCN